MIILFFYVYNMMDVLPRLDSLGQVEYPVGFDRRHKLPYRLYTTQQFSQFSEEGSFEKFNSSTSYYYEVLIFIKLQYYYVLRIISIDHPSIHSFEQYVR